MTKAHQTAIEMKYDGKTHKEIVEALKGKHTLETINSYFKKEGLLYIPYKEYEKEQNDMRMEEARSLFKKNVATATKVLLNNLSEAIKKNDRRAATELAKEILDRAGVVVIKQSEVSSKSDKPKMTYEELIAALRGEGINPSSGTRAPKRANGSDTALRA